VSVVDHDSDGSADMANGTSLGGRTYVRLACNMWNFLRSDGRAQVGQPNDFTTATVGLLKSPEVTGEVLLADGGLTQLSPMDPFGLSKLREAPSCEEKRGS
jgi:hypothetical protein